VTALEALPTGDEATLWPVVVEEGVALERTEVVRRLLGIAFTKAPLFWATPAEEGLGITGVSAG